ncbi:MAG TPA: efflux RND transporter periplasmic adaptor subunit [Vicinamibacterales bacterium]|nr:efflux RND transporter periplasmic adaptor subunit [Vicinamibacterales bacterium]
MTRKKALIILGVIIIGAAVVGANFYFKRQTGTAVNAEALRNRDLESIVSASGKIQPKTQVNISANTTGRVTRLAVDEGERVKSGQFLLEIDPRSLQGQLQRGEASVAAAQSSLLQSRTSVEQARTNVEQAQAQLDLAQQTLKRQQDLWKDGLTTKQDLEQAENEVKVRQTDLKAREADVKSKQQAIQTSEEQIKQEQAGLATTRYTLTQVIMTSPIDGLVTRRNIEQGETAVMGTMNNAGTVLLTIADMSVLDAEVEVDETDIPEVSLGQQAKVMIDAVPDRTFKGHVTEIGNSPIQQTNTAQTGQRQATTFKVKVTLDEQVPDVRPGFTCTAEITTATKNHVVAVPIQALTVREMLFNEKGDLVHEAPPKKGRNVEPTVSASTEPPPGHTRKETEGVFVIRDGRAVFTPVKVGIAGEKYCEVISGVTSGDQVITGPFANVRALADGEPIKLNDQNRSTTAGSRQTTSS